MECPAPFKDHFSRRSAEYSRYRPGYPQALFEFVASLAPTHELAVDCATGNGQAAVGLAGAFEYVVAIDASVAQLQHAQPHPNVAYVAATAEQMPLRSGSATLIVAAQAVHWFDFERFYAECRRVLRPRGIAVVWTYGKFRIDPAIDAAVDAFYDGVVGPYWPPERRYVEAAYRTLPFPLEEVEAPPFELDTEWDLETTLHYVETWSAVQSYRDAQGEDPMSRLAIPLAAAWPGGTSRRLRWPIHMRIGRT